jgi:hypothetical protein
MPIEIERKGRCYIVKDADGHVHAKCTSKANAEKQMHLLEGVAHGWNKKGAGVEIVEEQPIYTPDDEDRQKVKKCACKKKMSSRVIKPGFLIFKGGAIVGSYKTQKQAEKALKRPDTDTSDEMRVKGEPFVPPNGVTPMPKPKPPLPIIKKGSSTLKQGPVDDLPAGMKCMDNSIYMKGGVAHCTYVPKKHKPFPPPAPKPTTGSGVGSWKDFVTKSMKGKKFGSKAEVNSFMKQLSQKFKSGSGVEPLLLVPGLGKGEKLSVPGPVYKSK